MNTTDPALPNYVRPEAAEVRKDLDLMADLIAGTRRMWERAREKKYLRKWKDEDETVYNIRRECESVFEGLSRTLSACVGMLFARPPRMTWNASETPMQEHWQNLDGMGTAGPVLAKRFSDQSIRDGIGLILVDHPPAPAGVLVTAANEAELGLRPTWATYQRNQVVSWRTALVNNAQTLVQVVLEERGREPAGAYGVADVTRYRVLKLMAALGEDKKPTGGTFAAWELWRETKEAGANGFALEKSGVFRNRNGQTTPRLPVQIAYTGRTDAPLCSTIPLLGVAWANLSHWRISTALAFAREVAAYAQGVIVGNLAPSGVDANNAPIPGRVKLGPLALIHLVGGAGETASFDWKAPPTEAFDVLERGAAEKLKQIGQMGMAFMVTDTRAAETAEAKRLDATAENSTLATAAQGIEDAWNGGLEVHAWYLGIEKAGAPMMEINKDFDAVAMDPATMAVYVQAVKEAGLPPETLVRAWIAGGRLPADTDVDKLILDMEAGIQAERDAAADRARADAEAREGLPAAA